VTDREEREVEPPDRSLHNRLRIGFLVVALAWGCYCLGYMIYLSFTMSSDEATWLRTTIQSHYAGTVMAPILAITAFCVVVLLQIATTDPIEIEGLGFKFRGAAGPVVLWIFCFLALATGVKLLW